MTLKLPNQPFFWSTENSYLKVHPKVTVSLVNASSKTPQVFSPAHFVLTALL